MMLPATNQEATLKDDASDSDSGTADGSQSFTSTAAAAAAPLSLEKYASEAWGAFLAVGGLLGTKVVSSVANSMRETTLPLVLKSTFSMREQQLGNTMSFLSALNALVNGFLLGPVSHYFGGDLLSVVYRCVCALSVLCLVQAALAPSAAAAAGSGTASELYGYLATIFAMIICAYVLSTNATTESTSRVAKSVQGTLLGVEHSLFAFARIGGPAASVAVFKGYGVSGVAGVAAAIFASILAAWHSGLGAMFGPRAGVVVGGGGSRDGHRSASEERKEK